MRRSVAVTVVVSGVLLVLAVVAGASTITTPKGPYTVAADAEGNPAPFVVVASGFAPGANIFAEECDGNAPSTPRWSATLNCDLGSAPPPAIADANGIATFDGQSMFQPVAGPSPQHLFNCIAPGTSPPKNHLKTYTNCQVRVSSNNSQNTQDQSFITLVLPGPNAPRQAATTTSTAPPAGANHSATSVPKGAHSGKAKRAKKSAKAGASNGATQNAASGTDSGTPLVAVAAGSAGSSSDHGLTDPGAVLGYALILGGLLLAGVWRIVFHPARVA